jgi:hypothetical protein
LWHGSRYSVSDCGAISDFLARNDCSGCKEVLPTHGLCNDANYSSQCPACTSQCLASKMFAGGTDSACGVAGDVIGALRSGGLLKEALVRSAQRILHVYHLRVISIQTEILT